MSDEIQDTPGGATRAFLGALGFILLLLGAELMVEKDGSRFGFGVGLAAPGVLMFYAAVFWKAVKQRLNIDFVAKLNALALDPGWWIGTVLAIVAVVIFAPFVEQHRWPFTPTAKLQTQFDAKQHELEDTKRQLQEARERAKPLFAPEQPLVTGSQLVKQVQDLQSRLDTAERQLAEKKLTPDPISATQGPVNWDTDGQFLVVTGGGPDAMINSVYIHGTSTASVAMKEAFAVSGLTGHRQELMANVQYRGYFPVDKVDIPPQAPVWLELIFKPPLSVRDFLDQWGKFHLTIAYNDTAYEREFDENYVRRRLQQEIPGALGPRVTPRDDK